MRSLLRCYCAEAGYDGSDQLDMIEFQYNSFTSENTQHSPFETSYGYQPAAHVHRMLPVDDDEPEAIHRLTKLADTQAVVKELLKLSKDRQAARMEDFIYSYFQAWRFGISVDQGIEHPLTELPEIEGSLHWTL